MITLQVGLNNDLVLDGAGGISVISQRDALEQCCRSYMLAIRGEMIRKIDEGMPYDQVAWGTQANAAQFESEARARIMALRDWGVISVRSIVISQLRDVLSYTAIIETIYGELNLNG